MNTLRNILSIVLIASAVNTFGQTPAKSKHLPIIDVHVHTMKINPANTREMCPWFLTSMPGGDPNEKMVFKPGEGCADPLKPAKSDTEMQSAVLETMERLNMTMVTFGDAEILHKWYNAAPKGRIIPGTGIGKTVEAFRDSISNGFYKVMSEVAPQYQGVSPSDMSLDAYFAVAEEMNVPVGIHMGTGGNGMANITRSTFRASMGNPLILEDLLARHPKLKIWVQHAGYPMIDELIALMGANAYVYCDISGMIWSYPLDEVNACIKRIVQAGFGKRIMYGTDFMSWPKLFETSIGVIENAQYLSFDQKRDILFNNAVRFFRLDPNQFK